MPRSAFQDHALPTRLPLEAFASIPIGRPDMLSEQPVGTAWREIGLCGVRICILVGIAHDGPIIDRFRPIIRGPSTSRRVA